MVKYTSLNVKLRLQSEWCTIITCVQSGVRWKCRCSDGRISEATSRAVRGLSKCVLTTDPCHMYARRMIKKRWSLRPFQGPINEQLFFNTSIEYWKLKLEVICDTQNSVVVCRCGMIYV